MNGQSTQKSNGLFGKKPVTKKQKKIMKKRLKKMLAEPQVDYVTRVIHPTLKSKVPKQILPEEKEKERAERQKELDKRKRMRQTLLDIQAANVGGLLGNRRITNLKRRKEEENLGEEFETTPWLPPSVAKATQYKKDNIFRGGGAAIYSTDVINAEDLPLGISLYFQFVLLFGLCFLVISLLSIPPLLFFNPGHGVLFDDQDTFGFYHFSLGNLGYNKDLPDYHLQSACKSSKYHAPEYQNKSMSCVHFGGNELSLTDTGFFLAFFEILQIIFFVLLFRQLAKILRRKTNKTSAQQISVTDYAIMVTNLPSDISEEILLDHFDQLYRLDQKDFKERPIVLSTVPIPEVCGNTNLPVYEDKWIAECLLHKSVGRFIRTLQRKKYLYEKLFRARAKMKMYSETTGHADGDNQKKYEMYEQEMLQIGLQIDNYTKKNMETIGFKLLLDYDEIIAPGNISNFKSNKNKDLEQGFGFQNKRPTRRTLFNADDFDFSNKPQKPFIDHRVHDPNSMYYHMEADSCAAFIVFQYQESLYRCLEDYSPYSSESIFGILYSFLFYPYELRIQDSKLVVKIAPEPDQILWENLEVPSWKRFLLRLRTYFVIFGFILVSLFILLEISTFQNNYRKLRPDNLLCSKYIPEVYLNSSQYRHGYSLYNIQLMLPSTQRDLRNELNHKCQQLIPNSFYGTFVHNYNLSDPIAYYDINSCVKNVNTTKYYVYDHYGLCPIVNAQAYCPCLSTTSHEHCESVACPTDSNSSNDSSLFISDNQVTSNSIDVSSTNHSNTYQGNCQSFQASTIGNCYCLNLLAEVLSSSSSSSAAAHSTDSHCSALFESYYNANTMIYLAIFAIVIINVILRNVLKYLAKYDVYNTIDDYQSALFQKLFLSNFIISSILILIANGNPGTKLMNENPLSILGIFAGSFNDFNPSWYGNFSIFIIGNYLIQGFIPLCVHLFSYFVYYPLLRFYHLPQVKQVKSHSIVMQNDLNNLFVGEIFDSTDHAAQLMSLFFTTMMYSPGIPILMPLMCGFCWIYYYIDKFLLCRYFKKPLNLGAGVYRTILFYLPVAILLKLVMACWMYSNKGILIVEIFPKVNSLLTLYDSILNKTIIETYLIQSFGITSTHFQLFLRFFQPHVFPLFLLFLLIIMTIIGTTYWKQLPIYWIGYCIYHFYLFFAENCSRKDTTMEELAASRESGQNIGNRRGVTTLWELKSTGHPLRQQSSGFTEEFFRLVKDQSYIPSTFGEIFRFKPNEQLTDVEVSEGYRVLTKDQFLIHVKKWKERNVLKIDGTKSIEDELKKTYEVIADYRCFSYNIARLPAYEFVISSFHEGFYAISEHIRLNYQKFQTLYEKEKQVQQEEFQFLTKLFFEKSGFMTHIVEEYSNRKHVHIAKPFYQLWYEDLLKQWNNWKEDLLNQYIRNKKSRVDNLVESIQHQNALDEKEAQQAIEEGKEDDDDEDETDEDENATMEDEKNPNLDEETKKLRKEERNRKRRAKKLKKKRQKKMLKKLKKKQKKEEKLLAKLKKNQIVPSNDQLAVGYPEKDDDDEEEEEDDDSSDSDDESDDEEEEEDEEEDEDDDEEDDTQANSHEEEEKKGEAQGTAENTDQNNSNDRASVLRREAFRRMETGAPLLYQRRKFFNRATMFSSPNKTTPSSHFNQSPSPHPEIDPANEFPSPDALEMHQIRPHYHTIAAFPPHPSAEHAPPHPRPQGSGSFPEGNSLPRTSIHHPFPSSQPPPYAMMPRPRFFPPPRGFNPMNTYPSPQAAAFPRSPSFQHPRQLPPLILPPMVAGRPPSHQFYPPHGFAPRGPPPPSMLIPNYSSPTTQGPVDQHPNQSNESSQFESDGTSNNFFPNH